MQDTPSLAHWLASVSCFGRDHRMLGANRGCIILTARSCQISPNLVNQIDGAEVWARYDVSYLEKFFSEKRSELRLPLGKRVSPLTFPKMEHPHDRRH